ncbi:ABC transporter permease [Paraclostridium sordellii]|uniref:Oligopeptide transport system permease protein AppB n=1 Tax=Paraclostridium sordellii TaxID=1505 RepID=A0A0C7G7W1_PARSO|nr:ABC transporter permease [Paeniclostridium sordellii]QYE97117.1 ABC transporter permease [Paeniclostridium sordellii]CEN79125.1 oligopeptide transport system permease protein AppB [[Clostridium] sordellii] [Paeniclostridium sordellii]CEQ04273.1 oligopeptide transport system permease protein AppB [[Clostridium] sordellii] [Paeniclostridium sordellii]CEQ23537.1 oligopeptide transport system permease protein AppB [[Clostridium] sordellii] [Paeniclostridium sordellii]
MVKYILKRLFTTLVVLFGISIIIFTLIHLQPGNPYSTMIDPNVSPEVVKEMLSKIGYYDPIHIKYIKWISRALRGDLGYSIYYGKPVIDIISSRMTNTVILASFSLLISIVFGIGIGILSAIKKNTLFDKIATVFSFIGVSIPAFFFGLILIKVFSFDLQLLPVSGMKTLGSDFTGIESFFDLLKHLLLPGIVLAFLQSTAFIRYTRSSMIDVLDKEYIVTARAKGLSKNKAIFKHGLKNALIPIVTIICLQIPFLFSGALLTETVFVWPGIGRLSYEAVLNRDYSLIMGILMILSIIILLSNLLADILYAVIDPRIRYDK